MEAGHELDALVAEKVMGWRIEPAGESPFLKIPFWDIYDPGGTLLYTSASKDNFAPPYSTDIRAAWEVVETLTRRDIFLFLENDSAKGRRWSATFEWGCVGYHADADTAPLAICLAALEVMGGNGHAL